MTQNNATARIAILAYPGVQQSAVLGFGDLFQIANDASMRLGGGSLTLGAVTAETLRDHPPGSFDIAILPPNLSGARGNEALEIHQWLRDQHAAGAWLCSVCAGAFWLGHTGLLSGRPVTTHWALEDAFRAAFPTTHLNTDRLLIDDHDIVTAGGVMAWVDLGLFIVERCLGSAVTAQTARHLLVDTSGREQRNYRSFRPPLDHGDAAILKLQHWLEAHADKDVSVPALAVRAQLSPRTLLRRFKRATGHTPQSYIQNLRVEKARGLLERTRIPVSEIGWNVGYRDASAFGRVFRATTGVTAGEYRTRFGLQSQHGSPASVGTGSR